jgi:serine/threonine-protein kinase
MQSRQPVLHATQPFELQCGQILPLHRGDRAPSDNEGQLGGYDVVGKIARGGMGGVYLATDRTTGERVALKLLDARYAANEDIVERLFAERTVSASVRHPGLVDVRSADRTPDGRPYLVIEYLDGENLGELAERGRMELGAIVSIGAQIASAVQAMHEVGIIHCDIKPDNVFVLYEEGLAGWPRIKVIDYGVSRFVDDIASDDSTIAGTPACMAPEQWTGAPVLGSDVYALGCTLFELLTGDALFTGPLPQLMLAHCKEHAPRPSWFRSGIPSSLERLVMRMLVKDAAMRPTMREVARTLHDLADALPATTAESMLATG